MLASHKGQIPFVVYIIPFLAGIGLALSFNRAIWQFVISVTFGVLLGCFVLLNLFYNKTKLYRRQWVGGLLMHILLLLSGVMVTLNYDSRNHDTYFAKYAAQQLLVKVNSEPQFKNNFLRFTAEILLVNNKGVKRHTSGNILLTMHTDSTHAGKIAYGDELLIPANYAPVDPPFNPAEFNYKQYLAHQNIYAQAFVDPFSVIVVNHNRGNPVIAYSLQLRQRLVQQFKANMQSAEAIAVASTLILGYKAELDNEILQAYSKTGTIHVLSVSGAHVAIIFVMIGWLLRFMDRYRYGKYIKAVLSIGLIWYYSLLTGLSPAVCRAAVMISMVIIGNSFARNVSTLNVLAISAFFILLVDPFLIADVGFQLSYMAIIGLVVFQPIVYSWWDIENKWLDKLWVFCSASVAIQAVTFPLSAYYFHQFPVYFLLSNLLIIIPVEVIMYAGIVCLALAQIGLSAIAKFAGLILEKSILLMDWMLQWIERSPYSSIGKIWISRGEYLLLLAVIILLFSVAYYKRSGLLKAALACALLLGISFSIKRVDALRASRITFLNLKKHSGILFKQGNRAVLLTDLTDTDKAYRYTVQPYVDSSRISLLTVVPFAKDTATAYWIKRGNLIRFLNKDMLILNRDWYSWQVLPKVAVNYIFVTGSPHPQPGFIDANFTYQALVADAGNTDKAINALKAGLNSYDKKIYLLKRNKSLIVQSNK